MMIRCSACSREIVDDSRLCSYCGAAVVSLPVRGTVTEPAKAPPQAPSQDVGSASSSDSIDQARFTPGTMLTDRYRIVGLLGKGGMGEVYRADDLKLRQPVALKFLPVALTQDARRLERFHHEVRVARQVSHPNVCRVYDINEADGQAFITMEYIDGEDLASILRRMGRPSKDKALQIARQLCAGLAAAHDKGVLHRDLKPHNVMIDGQGRVRVTDFGLAGFVDQFTGGEIRAGTPAYMAPEQLAGREVSVKSDIYSLGLVLFEMFTGQRAFEGATRERPDRTRNSLPTSLSSIVEEIDPAVERVILRCLEAEPSARPSSALAVAAALPGGDPLAAALAAGETPDPAMVAAGGEVGGLRPAIAIPCLLGVLVGIVAVALLNNSVALFRRVSLPQPPAALAFRAGEILKKLGHTAPAKDTAFGFAPDEDLLRHIQATDKSAQRWDKLATNRPPAVYFWYRQSPRSMIPAASVLSIKLDEPPLVVSGMANLLLDPDGRLLELAVVPAQHDETEAPPGGTTTNWAPLFTEAQLDFAGFEPATPQWTPIVYCDEHVAWTGPYPELEDVSVRVEAGAYRGRPTFFKIIGPWTKAMRQEEPTIGMLQNVADHGFVAIIWLVLLGSAGFAWNNLKLRRGDRKGAFRASFAFFLAALAVWALGSTHVSAPWREQNRFHIGAGRALYFATFMWLLYLAFEPYVRRRWPHTLISWTRVLIGRVRDPLVGRDILVGCLFGIGVRLLWQLARLLPGWFDSYPLPSDTIAWGTLLGGPNLAAELLIPWGIFVALFYLFVLFALRVLLRKQTLAVIAWVVIFAGMFSLPYAGLYSGVALASMMVCNVLIYSTWVVVLFRFGLLSFVVVMLVDYRLRSLPITLDFSAWYAGGSLAAMLTLVAVAAYGFHTALAGRPLLRDELLET